MVKKYLFLARVPQVVATICPHLHLDKSDLTKLNPHPMLCASQKKGL